MSNSTLDDFYRGMKMPNYDGKNLFTQMNGLNSGPNTLPILDDGPSQPQITTHQPTVTIKESVS